jgi:hypothetical protein
MATTKKELLSLQNEVDPKLEAAKAKALKPRVADLQSKAAVATAGPVIPNPTSVQTVDRIVRRSFKLAWTTSC